MEGYFKTFTEEKILKPAISEIDENIKIKKYKDEGYLLKSERKLKDNFYYSEKIPINPALKNIDINGYPEKVLKTKYEVDKTKTDLNEDLIDSLKNQINMDKITKFTINDKEYNVINSKYKNNMIISNITPFLSDYLKKGFIIIIAGTMAISGLILGTKIIFYPTKDNDENKGRIYYYNKK